MLISFYNKIATIISGSSKELDVEKRLFNISVFIAILVSIISIAINLQLDLPNVLHYIIGTGALLLTFIYIRARLFKIFHIWLFIFASLSILSGSWLYNEGPSGSINYLYILAFIIFLSIRDRKWHLSISLVIMANLIVLYTIYYLFPNLIHPYATADIRESDMLFTYTYVIIFSAIVFSALRRNYENEKNTVEIQKSELLTKNNHITDSILYAKEIQQALLQNIDNLNIYIEDYFVFWSPKDIISGDFYSFRKFPDNPNKVICTVSDCTGHGVPGALLTMLGLSFFNEIFLQYRDLNANEFLEILREKIKGSLQQGLNSFNNRDGMDMAIIIFDKNKRTINYAGANRPLYIIRDGKLLETKPDRMQIGTHYNDIKPYTNHVIELFSNDSIYLCTDGFADQFGEKTGSKFFTSNFKKLLIQNSHLPMKEQGEIIKSTFENWKGKNDQTDDVLVVGIKPELN